MRPRAGWTVMGKGVAGPSALEVGKILVLFLCLFPSGKTSQNLEILFKSCVLTVLI